jgi:hypothetical protein
LAQAKLDALMMAITEIITKDEKTKQEKQTGKCRFYMKWKPR